MSKNAYFVLFLREQATLTLMSLRKDVKMLMPLTEKTLLPSKRECN
jgi:hypothetical protein